MFKRCSARVKISLIQTYSRFQQTVDRVPPRHFHWNKSINTPRRKSMVTVVFQVVLLPAANIIVQNILELVCCPFQPWAMLLYIHATFSRYFPSVKLAKEVRNFLKNLSWDCICLCWGFLRQKCRILCFSNNNWPLSCINIIKKRSPIIPFSPGPLKCYWAPSHQVLADSAWCLVTAIFQLVHPCVTRM